MNAIKNLGEYRVCFHAIEGVFMLCIVLGCLAVSWFVRHDPII